MTSDALQPRHQQVAAICRLVQQQNVLYEQDYLSPRGVPVEGEMQDIPLEGEELDDPLEGEEHLSCISGT